MRSSFYEGTVFHKRYTPKSHMLKYRVFNIFINLDELDSLQENNRFFSINRFNLISFHERDHGNPKETASAPLKVRILDLLQQNKIDTDQISKIELLTYPRILGFVFNPLTIIYCRSQKDDVEAIIYEVRNTFGERHNYIYCPNSDTDISVPHSTEKCFHVSPFFERSGQYQFKLSDPAETVTANIDYWSNNEKQLTANFTGIRRSIDSMNSLALFFKLPFMTLKVVAGILFEATKLWLKGLKVFPHPENHPYQSTAAIPALKLNKSHEKLDQLHD